MKELEYGIFLSRFLYSLILICLGEENRALNGDLRHVLSGTLRYVKNQIKQLLIIQDCQRKIKPELFLQNKKAISHFLMLFLRDVPQENK